MPAPSSMRLGITLSDIWKRSGIVIGMFPSTRRLPIELQMTSAGATAASSKWTSIFLPASSLGEVMSTASIPLSTKRFYFRARHRAAGGFATTNGPFTAVVSAKPTTLEPVQIPAGINAARNVEYPGSDIWISTANKHRIGSQNTTGYKIKDILIPFSELVPQSNASKWGFSSAYAHPNSTGGSTMYAPVVLPLGAVATNISFRLWKNGAPDAVKVEFLRINTTGGVTSLVSHTYAAGSGFLTYSTAITAETVTSTKHYIVRVSFANTAAGTNERYYWYDITYRMPTYEVAY